MVIHTSKQNPRPEQFRGLVLRVQGLGLNLRLFQTTKAELGDPKIVP